MNFPVLSLGSVVAIVVLVLAVVLLVVGHALTAMIVFGLIAALAVARLT